MTEETTIIILIVWNFLLTTGLLIFMALQSGINRETMAFLRNLMDTLGRLR